MVILAIVIIIALIVAAILGQFPGMGGSARSRGSSAFWQSAEIGIVAHSVAEDGSNDDVVLIFRNNKKSTITITNIDFDDTAIYTTDFVMAPGEMQTITVSDAGAYCTEAGDSYTIELNVTYTDDETENSFSFTGGGNKLEGKCAN